MFARISRLEGEPTQIEESMANVREYVLPSVQQLDGFEGMYVLADRESGTALAITLWASQEALQASEEAANTIRNESARMTNERIAGVERYEVLLQPSETKVA